MSDLDILEITEDDVLYRYLTCLPPMEEIEPDGKTVMLTAYYNKDHSGPDGDISVFLARRISPEELLARLRGKSRIRTCIGALPASVPIRMGLAVLHTPEQGGPAHVSILGVVSDRHCRLLALATAVLPRES